MNIKRYKHELEFFILIIAICLIWYFGRYFHVDTKSIQQSLKNFPLIYSGIIYIVLYVVVTFFVFFSKDLFWLMGAVLFGAYWSALFIYIAEIINAFILFYLARYLGRAYVEKSLAPKYKRLDERISKVSFFWLFIFRAAPLIPYRFQDLAAGLTRIDFRKYLTAAIVGSPLKLFWIQYILATLGENAFNPYALTEYFLQNKALLVFSFIYIVLVMLVFLKIKIIEE